MDKKVSIKQNKIIDVIKIEENYIGTNGLIIKVIKNQKNERKTCG
jgi:hypothetical protein